MRRLAAKTCKRKGFGWKRWSSALVYGTWRLFRDYRVVYWSAKVFKLAAAGATRRAWQRLRSALGSEQRGLA